ncbi:MAG: hypothetical protein D8B59_09485 [Bacteroidetes bacterium]|jgi:hypothetical protein|nr:MAG: hypothetical protein D8B59_09485 [Bacteroidota bacterium]
MMNLFTYKIRATKLQKIFVSNHFHKKKNKFYRQNQYVSYFILKTILDIQRYAKVLVTLRSKNLAKKLHKKTNNQRYGKKI